MIGRADDMVVVRGVNLYPSAVEDLLRADGGVGEFRVELFEERGLQQVRVQVERLNADADPIALEQRIQDALHRVFSLQCKVECVDDGALPRFETKSRRWIRT